MVVRQYKAGNRLRQEPSVGNPGIQDGEVD